MGIHYERARILIDQSRHDLAERELLNELAIEPDCPYSHAIYALCLAKRKDYERPMEEAETAVRLAPYLAYTHVVMANVLCDRDLIDEAHTAITEAIRLDPENPHHYALSAHIYNRQQSWQEALEATDVGLRLNAEDAGCRNVRAFTLMKLGRHQEADAILNATLAKNPEDAVALASRGWALLERKQPARATMPFREALRLDPHDEWARAGLLQAVENRNLFYRCVLKVFQWLSNADGLWSCAFLLLCMLTIGMFADEGKDMFDVRLLPFVAVAGFITAATWLTEPMRTLVVCSDPMVRRSLPKPQIVGSTWCAIGLGLTVLLAIAGIVIDRPNVSLLAFWPFAIAIFSAVATQWDHQRARYALGGYAIISALVGVAAVWTFAHGLPEFRFLGPIFVLSPFFAALVASAFTPDVVKT